MIKKGKSHWKKSAELYLFNRWYMQVAAQVFSLLNDTCAVCVTVVLHTQYVLVMKIN